MARRYLVLVIGTFGERGSTFHEIGAVWRRLHGIQLVCELRMDQQVTGHVVTHENGRFYVVDPLTEDGLRVAEECDALPITYDANFDNFHFG